MDAVNVLIVEDKKEDAVLLEKILKEEGYKVWCSVNGQDGIRLAKTTPFAVIVTELLMPEMNGEELTEFALGINPNTGVVVMTSTTFISSAVEAMEAGAYGYITKPLNPAEVKIVVKRAVERFELLGASRKKDQYAEMSVKDGLTGVYNRRFLDVFLRRKISSVGTDDVKFAILMIDIDHFKNYNDTKGHRAGDELLSKMARLFQDSVRQRDVVFRYGGEEFLIYLEDADKETARLVAERIRTSVELYLSVTVSIGLGGFPVDGQEEEALIKKADAALYNAKESGRNKICVA